MEISDCLANAQLIRQRLIEPFILYEQGLLALAEQQQLSTRIKEERADDEEALKGLEHRATELEAAIARSRIECEAAVAETAKTRATLKAELQAESEQAERDRRVMAQVLEQDRAQCEAQHQAFRAAYTAERATLEAELSALRSALAEMQRKRQEFLASIGAI